MLTHTGRTYTPGSPHPRRCEHCRAPATWERDGEPRCHAHSGHSGYRGPVYASDDMSETLRERVKTLGKELRAAVDAELAAKEETTRAEATASRLRRQLSEAKERASKNAKTARELRSRVKRLERSRLPATETGCYFCATVTGRPMCPSCAVSFHAAQRGTA